MGKFFKQWSTWRGLGLVVASAVGLNPALVSAGVSLIDHVPELAVAAVGLYDTFRDETKKS